MRSVEFHRTDHGLRVREERAADCETVFAINAAAFETDGEARLVDQLRCEASPIVSLVAEAGGALVGHILYTPVTLEADNDSWRAMALGPMAVVPEMQRRGIGSTLVEESLRRCAALDASAVFVLGHPTYYPRFGFEPASRYGCRCTWDVPDEVFMIKPLRNPLPPGGLVQYHEAFNDVS